MRMILKVFLAFILLLPGLPGRVGEARSAEAVKTQAAVTPSQAFARLAEEYWDAVNRFSPLDATSVNYPRYHDRLEDISAAGRAQELNEWNSFLAKLERIDRSKISVSEKISWDIMKLDLERNIERYRYKFYQWMVDHMDGAQSDIPSIVELAQPMKTPQDAEALISRIRAMPKYFNDQIDNLREGVKEGRTAVHTPVTKVIRQLEEELKTPAAESPFAAAAKKLPQEIQPKYFPLVVQAVQAYAYPAYTAYLEFLNKEYLPRARSDEKPGLGYLPDGEAAYRYAIRYATTLDKSPQEIHQVGLDELKDIHAEMESIARKMGYQGDLKSFLDHVRHDPKNFFTARQEVLKAAEDMVSSIKAKLPQYFGTFPKTDLIVKPIESYKEKNDVAARYFPPPDDLSRPGIYYINTYQPETRPRFGMASLAAHEGVPGHHLQIALALEQRGLPAFQRNIEFTSFVEGWALYSEFLGREMGIYSDDLSRVGMLSDQALRASRLVVDTGLHSMGWSRRKAIDFMKDNTPMSEEEIVAEVDRYISCWPWPAQALAYKMGQREILALRKESQARLGDKFDLRAFHDTVLKNGALPLPILRRIVLGGFN